MRLFLCVCFQRCLACVFVQLGLSHTWGWKLHLTTCPLRSHQDWTSTNLGLKHPTTAFTLSANFTVWESFSSSFSSPCFAGHSPQQGTLVSCSLWHRWTPLLSLCPAAQCHAVTWQRQHRTHRGLLCRAGTPAANWGGSPDVQQFEGSPLHGQRDKVRKTSRANKQQKPCACPVWAGQQPPV